MKILSAQRILNNTFKANNNEPTKHYLAKNESGDSFVRSNSNVSFKGGTRNLQKTAQKILGETDLLEKAGKFSRSARTGNDVRGGTARIRPEISGRESDRRIAAGYDAASGISPVRGVSDPVCRCRPRS